MSDVGSRNANAMAGHDSTSNKPNAWTISSVAIAACALAFSGYQGCKTREHDRITLLPRVSVEFDFEESGAGWQMSNEGLGPAEIRDFTVTVDGMARHSWREVAQTLKVQGSSPSVGQIYLKYEFSAPKPGVIIRAGDMRKLWWVTTPDVLGSLKKQAERVVISLTYCSLFRECWITNSNSLSLVQTPYPESQPVSFSMQDEVLP